MNSGYTDDVVDIETLFTSENLGAKLVAQFNTVDKASVAPIMICWLFFGRSFETMVERGEEIISNPTFNRFHKFLAARTIRMLIKKSVSLGLRTKDDWQEYYDFKKIIDSNEAMEWALDSLEEPQTEPKPLHHPEQVSALESMILLDSEKKKILLDKIGEYINTGVKGKRVAFMILALRGLGYLP